MRSCRYGAARRRDACGQDRSASWGREYASYLVRRSIREGRRVRHETLANVSRLPPEAIEALTLALKGVRLVPEGEIVCARKHGHVEAVLAAAGRLGVARLLDRAPRA